MMDFTVDTGYEDTHTAASDAMTGPASSVNQAVSQGASKGSATRGLICLWLAALVAYWLFGFLFRRQLA